MTRSTACAAISPALALVGAFVLAPLLLVLRVSLYQPGSGRVFFTPGTMTFANYALAGDPYYLRLTGFTIIFGLAVAGVVVLVAYPLALFLRTLSDRAQLAAVVLILVPKTAGLLATLFGLQRLLPRGLTAAVLTEAYLIQPYALIALLVHLRSFDPEWEIAARGLGAGRWGVFRRITWPLSRPGVLLAFQFGLMWGLGAFLGPLFLGGPEEMTLSVEIHRQAFEYGRWPRAAVLSVCLLTVVGGALFALLLIPRVRGEGPR